MAWSNFNVLVLSLILGLVNCDTVLHDSSFAPDVVLNATYGPLAVGCKLRSSIMINGTVPGPAITLQENSTTWIRVYNSIEDQNLTIHWHGLSQAVAPFSDGTPRASQWPIPPMHFFDYEVRPDVGDAGTYFYHSHVDFQAATTAGPLVVQEASGSPPYTYDEERILFVSELYNKTDSLIVDGLSAPTSGYQWSGEAEALLLNGKAANSSDAVTSQACGDTFGYGPFCNSSLLTQGAQDTPCSPEVINVEPGKTYRFRTIGGGAVAPVTFGFEGHDNVSIIAADAQYTQPLCVDHMQIGPGQRFDFLLQAKSAQELQSDNKTQYLIQMETRNRAVTTINYAILSYDTSSTGNDTSEINTFAQPTTAPLTLPDDIWNWNAEFDLLPLHPNTSDFPTASEVTRRIYLSNHQLVQQSGGLFWTVDGQIWNESSTSTVNGTLEPQNDTPYLVSVYQNGQAAIPSIERANATGGVDPVFNAYPAALDEVLEIIILAESDAQTGGLDSHPWHIHGQHVYDLGGGQGNYDADTNEVAMAQRYNATGGVPPIRDTTWVYKYTDGDDLQDPDQTVVGWRGWRVRTNNAGVWMVHCHMLQHMIMGLQSVWVIGGADDITVKGLEESTGYLTYGGDVYGNETFAPTVNHYFGS